MAARKIAIGLQIGTQPPLRTTELFVLAARLMRLDSMIAIDHFQNVFPTALWNPDEVLLASGDVSLLDWPRSRGALASDDS